jgi:uncharacterized protein YodC (DUF2158 family)
MAATFKLGEVVRLNSGGPDMTVTGLPTAKSKRLVQTEWFAGPKRERGAFAPETLTSVTKALEDTLKKLDEDYRRAAPRVKALREQAKRNEATIRRPASV